MTLLVDPPEAAPSAPPAPAAAPVPAPEPGRPSGTRVNALLGVWLLALVLGLALVVYGFGSMFQDRTQRNLLKDYRVEVDQASNAGGGLALGETAKPTAPDRGSSVGILEIGRIKQQQVVVEGVGPSETRKGPGHVPGTAGLGQPGNAVVVGRRAGYGGPFRDLSKLHKGDKVVVTTTQGQSVYVVSSVKRRDVGGASVDEVYGPSDGDQLTLVTSATRLPWNGKEATVVVAKMDGTPFAPTIQGGRSERDTGGHPDNAARATAVLAILAYGLAMGASVLLYRRLPTRVAYLLTIGPIVALTIVTAETFSRLFPAWL